MRKGQEAIKTERGLTPLQENFAHEYLIDLDPGRAYIRAGYKTKPAYARQHGLELLKNHRIEMRIHELMELRGRMTDITAERVLLEQARIGFAKITDTMQWDDKGQTTYTPSSELSEEIAPAIAEFYETSRELDDGSVYRTRRFKMHDKTKMLQELAKHTGLSQEKGTSLTVNVETEQQNQKDMTTLFKDIDNWRAEQEKALPEERMEAS